MRIRHALQAAANLPPRPVLKRKATAAATASTAAAVSLDVGDEMSEVCSLLGIPAVASAASGSSVAGGSCPEAAPPSSSATRTPLRTPKRKGVGEDDGGPGASPCTAPQLKRMGSRTARLDVL